MFKIYKKVFCKDGFTMSVQAGETSYSTPRKPNATRYVEVEVGYPNEKEDLLLKYAEDPDAPTETVYAYVPSPIVALVIAKHGGMIDGELPPGVAKLEAHF